MMKKCLGLVFGFVLFNGLVSTVSCATKVKNAGPTGSDATSSSSTGGAAGAASATATGAGGNTGGGAGGLSASNGGTGGGSDGGTGGGIGEAGTGGEGGTGGTTSVSGTGGGEGGTGGTAVVAMNCEAADPDCSCDESGCYLVDGADCAQGSACKSQNCGVTQDNDSVCCAQACEPSEVCAADGTVCEPAAACDDEEERCSAEGDFQLCGEGQWTTTDECDTRGCNTELGGCLAAIGDACAASAECGEGTCQETPDGSSVCCDLSCGACKTCSEDGTSCEYPNTTRPDCDCTSDSDCGDGLDCTNDVCDDGVCANDLVSGTCLINDECYDHNQPEPSNPCRYCDAVNKNRGWTNSQNSVSCDDSLYCNGSDTCNGVGACQHQFPTNNRCTETGACALDECDEARDSCYEASGTQCSSQTQKQCESGCGGDVQSRTVTANCTGNSPDCTGTPTNPAFVDSTSCNNNQACNPSTFGCEVTLGCTNQAWCDPTGVSCWTLDEPAFLSQADAISYCNNLTLAGASWHLPSIEEWLALAKGCDGVSGDPEDAAFQSTCEWDGANFNECQSCPIGEGPGNGCYWPAGMGACLSEAPWYYWSSTVAPLSLYFSGFDNYVYFAGTDAAFAVRCATDKP